LEALKVIKGRREGEPELKKKTRKKKIRVKKERAVTKGKPARPRGKGRAREKKA